MGEQKLRRLFSISKLFSSYCSLPKQQQEVEEEMGRRGRGRGKTRRKHVNEEQESDASSARASGAEEADDEAEESESSRAKATGTTKKRKRDRRNKNFEREAPAGRDQSLVARKLEDAEGDHNEFVSLVKGDDMEMDDDISAHEEGGKGKHMEPDVDLMSIGDPELGPTCWQTEMWFENQRLKRLGKDGADCMTEGFYERAYDDKELPAESSEQEQGDTPEDTDTEDDIYWRGKWKKEGYERHHEKSDLLAASSAQEDQGKGEDMEAEDDIFWQSELEILGSGEWRKEGYEGHHDKSDPVAALAAQEEGVKMEGMKTDDNISSGGESEEETEVEMNRRKRIEEFDKEMDRYRGPKYLEALARSWEGTWDVSTSDGDEWKDAKGEKSWKEFYVPYASEIKTVYSFAEEAERKNWSAKLKEWPCEIPKCIKHRLNTRTIILEKRGEIRRLEEIKRVSEFCEHLVTWKPYIKHDDNIGTSFECLKEQGRIPVDVSTSLVIEAIQFLKVLLLHVECFFHPLVREGHKNFLCLAVRMHFRVKRHKLEEYFERSNLGIFRGSFPYLERAIERRKKESEEAIQVALHKKFDNYISSSDFEKEMQKRNFHVTLEELAEITKNEFKDLNRELIKVSLAERCEIIKLRHEIGAYSERFAALVKNDEERAQFAEIVKDLEKEVKNDKDVSVDGKLSQMLPVIHAKYFPTLHECYAVKGILHYLKLFSSNKVSNKKLEYKELWNETRSYDEKPHKAMRQPLMEGVFDRYLDVNRGGG